MRVRAFSRACAYYCLCLLVRPAVLAGRFRVCLQTACEMNNFRPGKVLGRGTGGRFPS